MPGPFELYLIRHGVAEDRGEAWPDDTKRPLTPEGISKLKKSARCLDRVGVSFDLMITSPFMRTRQTADVIAGELQPRPLVIVSDALVPGGAYQAAIGDLEKQNRRSRIAIVGHESSIGEFAACLIGARHPLEFKKGAICRIDVDQLPPTAPGDLRWFLTPRLLRRLGG